MPTIDSRLSFENRDTPSDEALNNSHRATVGVGPFEELSPLFARNENTDNSIRQASSNRTLALESKISSVKQFGVLLNSPTAMLVLRGITKMAGGMDWLSAKREELSRAVLSGNQEDSSEFIADSLGEIEDSLQELLAGSASAEIKNKITDFIAKSLRLGASQLAASAALVNNSERADKLLDVAIPILDELHKTAELIATEDQGSDPKILNAYFDIMLNSLSSLLTALQDGESMPDQVIASLSADIVKFSLTHFQDDDALEILKLCITEICSHVGELDDATIQSMLDSIGKMKEGQVGVLANKVIERLSPQEARQICWDFAVKCLKGTIMSCCGDFCSMRSDDHTEAASVNLYANQTIQQPNVMERS